MADENKRQAAGGRRDLWFYASMAQVMIFGTAFSMLAGNMAYHQLSSYVRFKDIKNEDILVQTAGELCDYTGCAPFQGRYTQFYSVEPVKMMDHVISNIESLVSSNPGSAELLKLEQDMGSLRKQMDLAANPADYNSILDKAYSELYAYSVATDKSNLGVGLLSGGCSALLLGAGLGFPITQALRKERKA